MHSVGNARAVSMLVYSGVGAISEKQSYGNQWLNLLCVDVKKQSLLTNRGVYG